jgi:uncharacterized protein
MTARSDSFDLGVLRLEAGEGREIELAVPIEPVELSGERYEIDPGLAPIRLDISRMTGSGYALRLRFEVSIAGPCMRCLESAEPSFAVDAREVSVPGEVDQLDSPYVDQQQLDLRSWARDALVLALPPALLCRADCAGLCPVCGENLNIASDHAHEREPDPRWAKLRELKLD